MICKITYYSEAEFDGDNTIQIQDELNTGDSLFVTQGHTMTISNVIQNNDKLTILDGEKMLILQVI